MKELRFKVLNEKTKKYVSPRDLDLAVDIGLPDDEPLDTHVCSITARPGFKIVMGEQQ